MIETWAIYFGNNMTGYMNAVGQCIGNAHGKIKFISNGIEYLAETDHLRYIDKPKFYYGDSVSPVNHPEIIGIICTVGYHFKEKKPIYHIKINGKIKSKRYFDDDLTKR